MTHIAARMSRFAPSGTMGMIALANQLKAEGREIITLVGGEPSFNTEEPFKQAGIQAIEENFLRYTPGEGIPELRKAISEKFKRENGLDYPAKQVIVAPGTKPLLTAAMMALADAGDEVIIPAPYWVSYPEIARIAGCEPVFVDCDPKAGFRLQPAALEAAITPRTRILLLCSPNNPTGAVYSQADLDGLVEVLLRHPEIWVVTDEIYEHVIFDGRAVPSIGADPRITDRVVTCNGLSKGYAMAGWRMGFAGGPANAMKAIGDIIGHVTGASNSVSQRAALAALTGDQSYIARNNASYQERRDLCAAAINQMPGLRCDIPEGAFYLYVDCSGVIGKTLPNGAVIESDTDFIMGAIEHAGVVMVPGSAFGMGPYFRMSFSMDKALLVTAMERLRRFCNSLV